MTTIELMATTLTSPIDSKKSIREVTLDEAKNCVLKDRNKTHGNPEDNFKTIGGYWTTYLKSRGMLKDGETIQARDVAALMILMKISRLATSPEKIDHWVDAAGYSACGAECSQAS